MCLLFEIVRNNGLKTEKILWRYCISQEWCCFVNLAVQLRGIKHELSGSVFNGNNLQRHWQIKNRNVMTRIIFFLVVKSFMISSWKGDLGDYINFCDIVLGKYHFPEGYIVDYFKLDLIFLNIMFIMKLDKNNPQVSFSLFISFFFLESVEG